MLNAFYELSLKATRANLISSVFMLIKIIYPCCILLYFDLYFVLQQNHY